MCRMNYGRSIGRARLRGPRPRRTYTWQSPGGRWIQMPGHDEQVERYEKEAHELQTQVKFLEDEVALLRRRLTNAPRQVTILEEKLLETRTDLARASSQNQTLADALR